MSRNLDTSIGVQNLSFLGVRSEVDSEVQMWVATSDTRHYATMVLFGMTLVFRFCWGKLEVIRNERFGIVVTQKAKSPAQCEEARSEKPFG